MDGVFVISHHSVTPEGVPQRRFCLPEMANREKVIIVRLVIELYLIDGKARQVMIAAEATLLASGTAALEAMLCKSPMVVGYRMKPFTYFLAKRLVKTKYISLPNLLADEMLVPEMIQEDCVPQKLAEQLSQYLGDDESAVKSRSVLIQRFTELHKLIQCDADSQAAQAVIDLLEQKHD